MRVLPWLVIGDFNEIRCQAEKEGGALRPVQQMAQFNASINYCGLMEVGFVGSKFTWLYQRRDSTQIRERLDKALASTDWHSLFPTTKLHHKSSSASDHNPLLLHLFSVRVLFSLAHRPKDPGPNSCVLVDWAWFTAAKWGLITNQVMRKSHKSP